MSCLLIDTISRCNYVAKIMIIIGFYRFVQEKYANFAALFKHHYRII